MPFVPQRTHAPFVLRVVTIAVMGASVLAGMIGTWAWPLVGDVSLMRYAVFLQDRGMAPYRDVVDINLPGTYAFERAAMFLFGSGPFGLRLYDWSLLLLLALAMLWFTGRRRWFAALFASLFFAVVHLQDGVAQQGQRDLILAVLALMGLGAFRRGLLAGSRIAVHAFLFGLSFGISFTIKPVLTALFLLCLALGFSVRPGLRSLRSLFAAVAGAALPILAVLGWLIRRGVLREFVQVFHSLLPLHASLGRRPFAFLLAHSTSPIGALAAAALVLVVLLVRMRRRPEVSRESILLSIGLAGTFAAYVLQGKGFPYQRYSFLAVLLLAIGLVLDRAFDVPGRIRAVAAGIALFAVGSATYFAVRSTQYEHRTPFVTALTGNLATLGTPEQMQGQVQCLDTYGGCINTLYDLRIRQSTGFLYDCYLFTAASPERDLYRQQFWNALQRTRPRILVVSSQNCFAADTDGYRRLASWDALDKELREQYREVSIWTPQTPVLWFSRRQMPYGFRLLVRK